MTSAGEHNLQHVEAGATALSAPSVAYMQPSRLNTFVGSTVARRVVAAVLMAGTGAVLGVAAWLSPAEAGHGTHEQLGLPACNWVSGFGLPCPTCGMTTSFSHAAEGDLLGSFVAQPFGCLLAIATTMTFLVSLYVLVTGSAIATYVARLWSTRVVWGIVIGLVAAWGYKILVFKGII